MSKKRWDYKICPICGAYLDIGEKCDCTQKKPPPEKAQERFLGAGEYKSTSEAKSA